MTKRRRLTPEERARREEAYRVWLSHDFDTAAAAAELGIEEKELRRWETVHRWWARWMNERGALLAERLKVHNEVEQLRSLLRGIDANGHRLFVPVEIQVDAASRLLEITLSVEGVTGDVTRAIYRGMIPDFVADLARMALGVDQGGEPGPNSPELQAMASDQLIGRGLATQPELRTLTLPELSARLRERLRERGFDPDPQA